MPQTGYVVLKPFNVTDAGWVTFEAPVSCDGFRVWSTDGAIVIGDKNDVNYQDTLLAGEIEDCPPSARGGQSGPLFKQGERVLDIKAVTGTVAVKARIYGQRAF